MKKFKFEDYQGKYAMWCKTEKEAKKFGRLMDSHGRQWFSINAPKDYEHNTRWEDYDKETCYAFNDGLYGDVRFLTRNGYTVLNFSDFDWSEEKLFTKADLKTGDFVVRANGREEMIVKEYDVSMSNSGGFTSLKSLNNDLTDNNPTWEITKVYRPKVGSQCCFKHYENGTLIYDRSEQLVEMTIEEISKALGKKVKVVG